MDTSTAVEQEELPSPPEICVQDDGGETKLPDMSSADSGAAMASFEALSDKDESDADVFAKSPSQDSFVPTVGAQCPQQEDSAQDRDSGCEKVENVSEADEIDNEDNEDLRSPPMPRPPPPSPLPHKPDLSKTSSSEREEEEGEEEVEESDASDSPDADQGYQAFGNDEDEQEEQEEYEEEGEEGEDEEDGEEDEEDEEGEVEEEYREEGEEQEEFEGEDGEDLQEQEEEPAKIKITIPGHKPKPKKPAPPPQPAGDQQWVNFEEDDDSFGFGEANTGAKKAPPRPSSGPPPKKPPPPKVSKPSRPPPPKPAPPGSGAAPPRRPPPPKKPSGASGQATEDGTTKKKKLKVGKKIKGIVDKSPLKTKTGKKKKKKGGDDDEDLKNFIASGPVAAKDSADWKEFEAMQNRITESMKHLQEKVVTMESGFEGEIKKMEVSHAQNSPWATLKSPSSEVQPNLIEEALPDTLPEAQKAGWVGFEDNFDVVKQMQQVNNANPENEPKEEVSDLLGISNKEQPSHSPNNPFAVDSNTSTSNPFTVENAEEVCANEAPVLDPTAFTEDVPDTGDSSVAVDLVDEFLGVEAVKAATAATVTDPLKKLEMMKMEKEGIPPEDDDPFGLGTKPTFSADSEAKGDLFILDESERQEQEEQKQEEKKQEEDKKPEEKKEVKVEILSSKGSDILGELGDFNPRAPSSESSPRRKPPASIARPRARPKNDVVAANPYNLQLAQPEPPPPPPPEDEGPSLMGEDETSNPFASDGLSTTNPFAESKGSADPSGMDLFGDGLMDVGNISAAEAVSGSFNPFATITDGDHPDEFDPFQTIHDDDAFDVANASAEKGDGPTSPGRVNPFDKEPPLDANFVADFKKDEEKTEVPAEEQLPIEEVDEPLEPYHPAYDGPGWKLLLRQPIKKKLTQNRFWKPVFVRLVMHKDVPTIKVFNNDQEAQPIHELPLQPSYNLCNLGLQQFDQFGKCHTVKIQYVFYRERVGVKADRLTPTLSDLTRVRDFKGLKDLVHRPKTTMILDHAPQASELLKFGGMDYEDFKCFIRTVEDSLFHLRSGRDGKSMQYTKDEITVDVVDEYYADIDKDGHITFHKGRVRMFCLAFITGSTPRVEVGLNDKRRQGKEIVGRKDIVPIKTDEWIKIQDAEFHCTIDQNEYEKTKLVKFVPLDAVQYELMRFRTRPRLNKELPLQIRCQMSVIERHVEIRCDVMISGYGSSSRRANQTPCEDIQIRFPIPEPWWYFFRVEKRFKYGAVKSSHRKAGKIKGLERLTMMAQGMMPPSLIEVSKGQAKFENIHQAIVWRIPKLPERNEQAYKTHVFTLKLDLEPHDTMPETFDQYLHAEYHMPNSTVSRAQIRSIGVNSEEPPDRWVHHLARYEYKVGIEFVDKLTAPLQQPADADSFHIKRSENPESEDEAPALNTKMDDDDDDFSDSDDSD